MLKIVKKAVLFSAEMIRKFYRRFSKFFIVGLSGTAVDLGIVWVLNTLFYNPAYKVICNNLFFVIAFELSVISNFLLSYFWVWKDRQGAILPAFFKYNISTAAAFVLRFVFFNTGVFLLDIDPIHDVFLYYFVYLFAAGPAMIFNFLLIEFKVFVQKKRSRQLMFKKGKWMGMKTNERFGKENKQVLSDPLVSFILPTFNERENIVILINRICKAVRQRKEFIVVDDDSPDGTAALVEKEFGNDKSVRLIVRKNERGLASAIRRGIDESRGDILVWMDCDLSATPETIPHMLYPLMNQGIDAAVASRYVKGGADRRTDCHKLMLTIHTSFSRIITLFTRSMLWWGFRDWTSGFIALRSSVAKRFLIHGDYGEYFIEMMYTILKMGYSVKEIPYDCVPRERGESKTATNFFGFFRRGIKYVVRIFSLKLFGISHLKRSNGWSNIIPFKRMAESKSILTEQENSLPCASGIPRNGKKRSF